MAAPAGMARIAEKLAPENRFLTARMVGERYSVSAMTIWRWLKADNGFPRPFYIGRNRYWRLTELDAWERSLRRVAA